MEKLRPRWGTSTPTHPRPGMPSFQYVCLSVSHISTVCGPLAHIDAHFLSWAASTCFVASTASQDHIPVAGEKCLQPDTHLLAPEAHPMLPRSTFPGAQDPLTEGPHAQALPVLATAPSLYLCPSHPGLLAAPMLFPGSCLPTHLLATCSAQATEEWASFSVCQGCWAAATSAHRTRIQKCAF